MSPVASPRAAKRQEAVIRQTEYDSDEELEQSTCHTRQRGDVPLLQSPPSHHLEAATVAKTPRWTERLVAFRRRNDGLLLIALSQLFFACMGAGVAYLSQLSEAAVSTSELIATRMFITALCCHGWLRWHRDEHPLLGPPGIRLLLVLRGVVGFFGLFGAYFSLRFLPLSDATVLAFLSPFITGIVASVLLKESYRPIEAVAALVSLSGVILIAKPKQLFPHEHVDPIFVNGKAVTDEQRVAAVCVAILGCFGSAGAYTTLRVIGKRASPTHSIQYFAIWSTFLACLGPLLLPHSQRWFIPTNPLFTVMLITIGIAGFLGQFFLTMGLAREKAGRGSLATFLQMPMSMLLERIIFHRVMDAFSFLGASIIVASALVVLLTKPPDQKRPVRSGRSTSFSSIHAEEAWDDHHDPEDGALLPPATVKALPLAVEDAVIARVASGEDKDVPP